MSQPADSFRLPAVTFTSPPQIPVSASASDSAQVPILDSQFSASASMEAPKVPSVNQTSAKSSVPATIPLVDAPSYAKRFKASLRNLRKINSPSIVEDGIPVVQAPKYVLLQTANLWKGHIVAHFHGLIPPPAKIFSDLNPAWGKYGEITIQMVSNTSCLILIPCLSTREWVLQVGYWQAGNCSFSVHPWSSEGSLVISELATAPTWAILKNVPPQMYSLDGLSVIASAIGEPLHTEKSRLDPYNFSDTKVKVEICLDSSPPTTIIVRDAEGNQVRVNDDYPRLPPKCCNCGRFGHLLNRCPQPLRKKGPGNPKVAPFVPGGVAVKSTKISLALVAEPSISHAMVEAVKLLPIVPLKIASPTTIHPVKRRSRSRSCSKGRRRSAPHSDDRFTLINSGERVVSVTVDHRALEAGSKDVVVPRPPNSEFQLKLKVPHKGQKKVM